MFNIYKYIYIYIFRPALKQSQTSTEGISLCHSALTGVRAVTTTNRYREAEGPFAYLEDHPSE